MRSNLILGLGILMAAASARADHQLPIAGGQWVQGYSACSTFVFSSDRNRCIDVVANRRFDSNALNVCTSISSDSTKLDCLAKISGKSFAAVGVNVCSSLTFGDDKTNCLASIANQYLDPTGVSVCTSISFTSDKLNCVKSIAQKTFSPLVAQACGSFTFGDDKVACLNSLANAYLDPAAVSVCSSISSSGDKNACYRAIANKFYFQAETDLCSRMTFGDDKASCLARTGRPYAPAPIVVIPQPQPTIPVHPRPFERSGSCAQVVAEIRNACVITPEVEIYLSRRASFCDTAESDSGKTRVQALVKKDSGDVLVVNTRGNDLCRIKRFHFSEGAGAAYLNTVRGKTRSDKIFIRMNEGQLFYMDMGHHVYEVKNASDRSYHLRRFTDLGNETIELEHMDGGRSTLTFDQIDARRRTGRVEAIEPVVMPSWLQIILSLGW